MSDSIFDLTNPNFLGIMWRFAVNIVFLFILIRVIYFRYSQEGEISVQLLFNGYNGLFYNLHAEIGIYRDGHGSRFICRFRNTEVEGK